MAALLGGFGYDAAIPRKLLNEKHKDEYESEQSSWLGSWFEFFLQFL